MAFELPPIKAQIVFDKTSLDKGLAQATKQTDAATKKMSASFAGLDKTIKRIGIAIGAVFASQAVRRFLELGRGVDDLQDSLEALSGSAETAERQMDALLSIANEMRVGVEDTGAAFRNLSIAGLASADNLRALAAASTLTGRSQEELSRALRTGRANAIELGFGLQSLTKTKKGFVAVTADGTKILAANEQALGKQLLAYYGTQQRIEQAKKANEDFYGAFTPLKNTLRETSKLLTDILGPALVKIGNYLTQATKKFNDFLQAPSAADSGKSNLQVFQETLSKFTEEKVIAGIKTVGQDLKTIAQAINSMDASKLSELSNFSKGVGAGAGGLGALNIADKIAPLATGAATIGLQGLVAKRTLTGLSETLIQSDEVDFDDTVEGVRRVVATADKGIAGIVSKAKTLIGRAGIFGVLAVELGVIADEILEILGISIDWQAIWAAIKEVAGSALETIGKGFKTIVPIIQLSAVGIRMIIDSIALLVASGIQKLLEFKQKALRTLADVVSAVNQTSVGDFLVPDDVLFGPNGLEQNAADAGTAAATAAGIAERAQKRLNENSAESIRIQENLARVWADLPPIVEATGRATEETSLATKDLNEALGGSGGTSEVLNTVTTEFDDATGVIKGLADEIEDLRLAQRLFNASDLEKAIAEYQAQAGRAIRDIGNVTPEDRAKIAMLATERLTEQSNLALLEAQRTSQDFLVGVRNELQDANLELALFNATEFEQELAAANLAYQRFLEDLNKRTDLTPADKETARALATQTLQARIAIAQESQTSFMEQFAADLDSAVGQGLSEGLRGAIESGDWKVFFSTLGESLFNTIIDNAGKALVQSFFSVGGGSQPSGGGAGGLFGSLFSIIGGLFGGRHGGTVTKDGFRRFAVGGVVPDLGRPFADSVPALLMPGERVLTRDENKRMEKGVGHSVAPTVVLNIQTNDVESFRQYLVKEQDTIVGLVTGNAERNGRARSIGR